MNFRLAPLFLLLLLSCEQTNFSKTCGSACYTGPKGTLGVGTCRAGSPVCSEEGDLISCDGEVTPRLEHCGDSQDTDCSGSIGDHDPRLGQNCGHPRIGICRPGKYECINNNLSCVGSIEPGEEVCDTRNQDEDCDGASNNLSPSLCYEGDVLELTHSLATCRPGIAACVSGETICVGQKLPSTEICHTGADEDCDGFVDGTLTSSAIPDDIVLIVDLSCSMMDEIVALSDSLVTFIETHDNPLSRYSLVTLGYELDSQVTLRSDFITGRAMIPYLEDLVIGFGGFEYSYDALVGICLLPPPISWRAGATRVVMLFTDEEGQTLYSFTEPYVAAVLGSCGVKFYGFIHPGFWEDFDSFADVTGGKLSPVNSSSIQYESEIGQIFESNCSN